MTGPVYLTPHRPRTLRRRPVPVAILLALLAWAILGPALWAIGRLILAAVLR